MIDKARKLGLGFREDFLADRRWFDPDPAGELHDSFDFPFSWLDTLRRAKGDREFKAKGTNTCEDIHPSAAQRFQLDENSWPPSFVPELQRLARSPSPTPDDVKEAVRF